jgi:hypothetical protein
MHGESSFAGWRWVEAICQQTAAGLSRYQFQPEQ